jgi:hypothetical protein
MAPVVKMFKYAEVRKCVACGAVAGSLCKQARLHLKRACSSVEWIASGYFFYMALVVKSLKYAQVRNCMLYGRPKK